MTVICVSWIDSSKMKACNIPKEIVAKIEVAPPGLLKV